MENNKLMKIATPFGKLTVEEKGGTGDYPGVWISLEAKDKSIPLVTVEYNEIIHLLQAVIYGEEASDNPTDIIRLLEK